jgi:transposase
MPQNFLSCEREQVLLLPASLSDWLPEDHLAWFVLAAVEELDLGAFYGDYRADGHGRAAHDPAMMVGLLLYAYSRGQRSARGIERECVENVAFRVVAANQVPDHATIARFRQRHETAIAGLFSGVLGLCAEAGMVKVGVVAVDGTKIKANASQHSNRDYEQIASEILAEAGAIDAAEDERYGERRGDELPPELATSQGRRGWLRDARQRLDAKRELEAAPIARDRPPRLREAKRRLEEELSFECAANTAYEAYRARGVMSDGRRFGARPTPYQPPQVPAGKINVVDLDSRNVKTPRGYMQGYNAQAAVNEAHVVVAAEVTAASSDFGHLEPIVAAVLAELQAVGRDRAARRDRC